MQEWHKRLTEEDLGYDEIKLLDKSKLKIEDICESLNITPGLDVLSDYLEEFCKYFERLNASLLKYIPGKPEPKWCKLMVLLAKGEICLPKDLENTLTNYVVIPDDCNVVEPVVNEIPANITGTFSLGHSVCVKISKSLKFKKLKVLVNGLEKFVEPLNEHMDILVYFSLEVSVMFNKYHEFNQQKLTKERHTTTPSSFSDNDSQSEEDDDDENDAVKLFAESLGMTKAFLLNISEATYSQITAGGELDLMNLDLKQEFHILAGYILNFKAGAENELEGVKRMLELFQYAENYILKIESVIKQFQLQGCEKDPNFQHLKNLAYKVINEKHNTTVNNASEMLVEIEFLLFRGIIEHKHCLEVFGAISECAAFHQFVKDKKFIGRAGQDLFIQQHQLITAQLQHEDYDEQVLNNLFAAFKVISPFMDTKQNFKLLMDKVVKLDVSKGLKQLTTVTSNITRIQLWFSRAEVILLYG